MVDDWRVANVFLLTAFLAALSLRAILASSRGAGWATALASVDFKAKNRN